MSKNALVFVHEAQEGPGLLGEVLKEHGFILTIIPTNRQEIDAIDPFAPDLLVVMGGPMGVYETEQYPFLKAEIAFIQKRLAAKKPILGICLGAQLMAAALGQKVFKGKQGKEIGWSPLQLTEAGRAHAVSALGGEKTNMLHWHGDTFDLPAGAVLLASSSLYPHQAYTVGENALALQCHPELKLAQFSAWLEEGVAEIAESKICAGLDELRRQNGQYMDILGAQARAFFTRWLQDIKLI